MNARCFAIIFEIVIHTPHIKLLYALLILHNGKKKFHIDHINRASYK